MIYPGLCWKKNTRWFIQEQQYSSLLCDAKYNYSQNILKQVEMTEINVNKEMFLFDPFSTNVPFLCSPTHSTPTPIPENLGFSDVFMGYRSGTLVKNGLRKLDENFNLIFLVRLRELTVKLKSSFLKKPCIWAIFK